MQCQLFKHSFNVSVGFVAIKLCTSKSKFIREGLAGYKSYISSLGGAGLIHKSKLDDHFHIGGKK